MVGFRKTGLTGFRITGRPYHRAPGTPGFRVYGFPVSRDFVISDFRCPVFARFRESGYTATQYGSKEVL